ncbi:MAG TPA: pseudouridine synthase [Bryobacteraceae bacterium]|nr:pseudouridine synthase [Bryobacteraceae bacterium]
MRRAPAFKTEIQILHEDDAIVAVDKPAGLPAVPIPRSSTPSAFAILAGELKRRREPAYVVHRIDRFTSGVLLFAKSQEARARLVSQFLKHTPVRQYLAVVRGRVAGSGGQLVHYMRLEGMFQKVSRADDPKADRAELRYSVERHLRDATLVRVTLVTGFQNQIRVQFAAAGHPVIGDRKYRPEEAAERRIARVALHAASLEFLHPSSGKRMTIESALPADMRSLIASLSRTGRAPGG